MNEINNLPKTLPEKSHRFEIEVKGALTGTAFKGEFECEIPNLRTQSQIAKNIAILNQGLDDYLDIGTKNLHHMLSYLKYTLIKYPEFWGNSAQGMELYDINVIEAIYEQVLKFEAKWVELIWGTKKGKKEKE